MQIKTFTVDAFTNKAFKGNTAGICLLESPIDETVMQSIAAEINVSETAFLQNTGNNSNHFNIRYFSPMVEIPFCGHASVASSFVLFNKFNLTEIELHTYYGLKLKAKKAGDKVQIRFPLYSLTPFNIGDELLKGIGLTEYINVGIAKELNMMMIEIKDKQTLENLTPDFAAMVRAETRMKDVVVTCRSTDKEYDFYSRCFCPWVGIDEDPVTGSAHSVLAAYWSSKLGLKKMKAYQCSKRGGELELEVLGDNSLSVTANAKIMLEGTLYL